MSSSSQPSSGSSTANTLANVFAGALTGYVDAQNQQPVYVAQPVPSTAYGSAGTAQLTPANGLAASLTSSPYLILGVVLVAAILLLRK